MHIILILYFQGAISILAEKTITDEDNDYIYKNENDDDIYNSDDEENPSLTRMFRNLYNYQQGFIKKINPFVNPRYSSFSFKLK